MLATAKKGTYVVADSKQSGFVNIYKDPDDTTTYIKKFDDGSIVGKLTGEVKVNKAGIRFAEVVYDEQSLTNWIEDKGFVNMNLVSDNASKQTVAYYSVGDNVRVRSTPSTASDSNIITSVNKAKLVGYGDGSTVSGFVKLNSAVSNGTVYVKSELVTTSKSGITNPTTTNPEPTPKPIIPIIQTDENGNKTVNVLGAKIPASNTNLIIYTVVVAAVIIGYQYYKKLRKS